MRVKQSNLKLGNKRSLGGGGTPAHRGKSVKLLVKRNGAVINRETLKAEQALQVPLRLGSAATRQIHCFRPVPEGRTPPG